MSGLFGSLSVALSGLSVSQQEMETTSNNVANANTPGYTREVSDVTATREVSPDKPPSPAIYVPMEQGQPYFPQFLVVRTAASPAGFAEPLRRAVARVEI